MPGAATLIIPKLFIEVEVRYMPFEFFYTNIGKLRLYGPCFVHASIRTGLGLLKELEMLQHTNIATTVSFQPCVDEHLHQTYQRKDVFSTAREWHKTFTVYVSSHGFFSTGSVDLKLFQLLGEEKGRSSSIHHTDARETGVQERMLMQHLCLLSDDQDVHFVQKH